MDIPTPPQTLDIKKVEALRNAFGHFYDQEKTTTFTDPATKIQFANVTDFVDYLYSPEVGIPKGTSAKHIGIILENWYETFSTAPEYTAPTFAGAPEGLPANLPGKATREMQKEILTKTEAELKQTREESKTAVEAAIKRQQELYGEEIERVKALENELKKSQAKLHVQVEQVQETAPTEEEQKNLEVVRQQIKANPQGALGQLENEIKSRLGASVPEVVARQAAFDIVQNVQEDSRPAKKSAIFASLKENSQILKTSVPAADSKEIVDWANVLSDQSKTSYESSQAVIHAAFGEGFQKQLLPGFRVYFSSTPKEGFDRVFSLTQIPSRYYQFVTSESSFLRNLEASDQTTIINQLNRSFFTQLDSQISKLSPGVSIGVTWSSASFRNALPDTSFTETQYWGAQEGSLLGRVALSFGFGRVTDFIGKKTGINLSTQKLVGAAVEKGAEALTGTGLAASITAAFSWTGPLAPIIGVIGAYLVKSAAGKLVSGVIGGIKDFAVRNKDVLFGLVGASFGFILGGTGGAALGGFGLFGLSRFMSGGIPGMRANLTSLGNGLTGVAGGAWQAFAGAIGIPIVATLIGLPILVALILFIINSGAYLVPPGGQFLSETNPYIGVEKEANPSKNPSPTTITYKVTITAKKDSLKGITIKADCKAIKKGRTLDCPPEKIPSPSELPESINAGTPYSFTFTVNYGSQYQDALVANNITVTAVSVQGGKVSEIGSSSVCFGKCPLDCFAFPDQYWPKGNPDIDKLKELLRGAAGTLAGQYPDFAAKVCSAGTVNLCYKPQVMDLGIFGWHEHGGTCDIDFKNFPGGYTPDTILFLLTHEASHHIQDISPGYFSKYMDRVNPPLSEPYICTRGADDPYESMAEADALIVAPPTIDKNRGCLTRPFQQQYPKHYNFAKNCMFSASCN